MTIAARRFLAAALALASVACDQATKRLAVEHLRGQPPVEFLDRTVRLVYAENAGAFGSLGASWPAPLRQAVFVAVPLLVLLAALVMLARRPQAALPEVAGLALLAGGGLGNLVDRVAHGYVVDFLWLGRGWLATNVFNVADVAIVAGVILLVLPPGGLKRASAPPPAGPPAPPAAP